MPRSANGLRTARILIIAAASLFWMASGHAWAQSRCADLATLRLKDTTLSTAEIPRGFHYPNSAFSMEERVTPSRGFCRVQGVIEGRTRFEIWLPERAAWNGRLQGVGGGGMAGDVPFPALALALEAGFAAVGSDLGHHSGFTDADWAIGHPERVRDWGHRATHEMTVRAKALVQAYYGRPPRWSYFTGCSGGGRQGLMEAQRYPGDYDGILAGDPTINFTRLTTAGRLWMQLAMFREAGGAGYVPAAKITHLAARVLQDCDLLDGVADGVLEDPRRCRFDPAQMICAGSDRDDCLTAPQAAAIRKVYAGAADSKGRPLFPGYEPGGELGPNGWRTYLSGPAPFGAMQWVYATGFLRGMAFEDRAYEPSTFDFDRDIARIEAKELGGETLAQAINAIDPDLSAFRARGGKLIHYHGWSDAGVAPRSSIAYYESVVARGGQAAADGFYRLFMVPGLQHCIGGPGATSFDFLAPLQMWVEQGRRPERVTASRIEDGKVVRTRPLCAYPKQVVWRGSGSTDQAANFLCKVPPS